MDLIKSIQRGQTASPNNTTISVTISAVDLTKSHVIISSALEYERVWLHDSTTLRIQSLTTTTFYTINWQVIESY